LLSYLSSLILDPGTRKDVGLTGVGYSGKFFGREGQELDEDIQNAQRKLLPFLGNKLSQALFLAVCAELRHVLDRNQQWSEFKHTNNKTFKNYIRNLRLMSDNDLKAFQSKRNLENPELEVSSKGYKTSYQAAKKAITETGGNVVTFARMAADAFTDLNWSASYGGKAWTDIAQGYIDLRIALNNYNPEAPSPSSESAEKLIAAIDHAFDLEHNTGTVLNKVKYFSVGGDYYWIATALDDKRDADMYSIASKASSDMRKLGHEVLKVAGIQDKQLKKVPAEAGIPTKKIKLSGFSSTENPSSLPIGSILVDTIDEFVGQVEGVNNSTKQVNLKIIAAKALENKKFIGSSIKYSFNDINKLKIVNKQDEANLLKGYFVDPNYKPEVTITPSELKIGDTVKVKNNDMEGTVELINKEDDGGPIVQIKLTKAKNDDLVGISTWYLVDQLEKISPSKVVKLQGFGKKQETTKSAFLIGDDVEVKNVDNVKGVVISFTQTPNGILYSVKVTSSGDDFYYDGHVYDLYGEKLTKKVPAEAGIPKKKISPSKVVKLQGFGSKKPAKNEALLFSTEIESPYMLTIGSILINIHSSDLYIVQMVNGPENYIKIKLVASNDALEFPNYTEPELYNGGTIARDFRLIENKDKERALASYEFIKLSSASREASKAANEDEPAPRERDESLKVGNYYVISNETNIVQITALPRGYVEYKIVAATKKYKELEGVSSGMPKDMFIDSIDFAINPKSTEFNYYIRQFKNKR
jgi:hypothetical protein